MAPFAVKTKTCFNNVNNLYRCINCSMYLNTFPTPSLIQPLTTNPHPSAFEYALHVRGTETLRLLQTAVITLVKTERLSQCMQNNGKKYTNSSHGRTWICVFHALPAALFFPCILLWGIFLLSSVSADKVIKVHVTLCLSCYILSGVTQMWPWPNTDYLVLTRVDAYLFITSSWICCLQVCIASSTNGVVPYDYFLK